MTVVEPKLRADALRNRRRVLDAAAAVFAERGLDAGVDEIARRAGVGHATVYRRFPTKDALVAELLLDRMQSVLELTESALADEPGAGFRRFMEGTVAMQMADRSLFEALGGRVPPGDALLEIQQRLLGRMRLLLERAQAAGAVRPDVTAEDVPFLAAAVSFAGGPCARFTPEVWRRYLAIVLDGLRPDGASPLPVRAPTAEQFLSACRTR
ncbi:MAG: TetR/AcrR family transcriptional regulator [Pseudomonadota bacterium]